MCEEDRRSVLKKSMCIVVRVCGNIHIQTYSSYTYKKNIIYTDLIVCHLYHISEGGSAW